MKIFSRSPWERPSVVSLRGPRMAQTSPDCEPTPEGGTRCADGTYHPPGCPNTPGSGIPAAAPTPGATVPLIASGVAAAAAGAYFLMAGHRHELSVSPAFESAYPEAVSQLTSIADKINTERANDAYYFSKYIEASKRRQDLVFTEDAAQKALALQERNWNLYHNNPDDYQAAQVAYDKAVSQKATAAQETEDARAGINTSAKNVMTYRRNAEAIISQLPSEDQSTAWKLIDPCSFKKTMEGRRLGQMYSWNSGGIPDQNASYDNPYGSTPEQRLLNNAQQSMNEPAPLTPEQILLKKRAEEEAQANAYGGGSYSGFNGFGNQMTYGSRPGGAIMGLRYPVVNR